MSLDLFQDEANARLTSMQPVANPPANAFDGFLRGAGMGTMRGLAAVPRAVDLLGSVGPVVQDAFTGGTEAQDRYFKEHDDIFQSPVDYWTPRSNEVGAAGQTVGTLLSTLPQVIISPGLAVATAQLSTAEELVQAGVSPTKAGIVGAVQGASLGLGVWLPVIGANLWSRVGVGAAGNVVLGAVSRGASGFTLKGTPAEDQFHAFDGQALTLDALMGMAFGGISHVLPEARAKSQVEWDRVRDWAVNLKPSDKAAIVTLREAQHLNVDSTPGTPQGPPDIQAHVERMRTAIDQLARDKPVNVEDMKQGQYQPDPARATAAKTNAENLVHAAQAVGDEDGIALPKESGIERARENNTFTGQDPGAGRNVGMTQPKGTPVDKLFANFADPMKPEALPEFRQKMFERANAGPKAFKNDPVATTELPFSEGLTARIDAAKAGNTRVQILEGETVLAAARIKGGMLDSIATTEGAKGRSIGENLLRFLGNEQIANVHEVPDRSPGFVAIQRKILSEPLRAPTPITEAPPAPSGASVPPPPRGGSGEAQAGAEVSPHAAQADRIVDTYPDMQLSVAGPDGPMTMSAREYLDTARAASAQAREDVGLFQAAAECLLGGL